MAASEKTLVIDNGSDKIKFGIPALHEKPLAFRTLIGTKDNGSMHVAGDDVAERAQYSLSEPVVKGVVQNFDHMEQIWSDCFKETNLQDCMGEVSVLLTEGIRNPKQNRVQTCERMFETFGVNRLYLTPTAPLALYASNTSNTMTGLVVECGYNVCTAVPIINGTIIDTTQELRMGGKQLIESGVRIMNVSKDDSRAIIEAGLCNVASDFGAEMKQSDPTMYIPKALAIDRERIRIPEPLFAQKCGLHTITRDALDICTHAQRSTLQRNIVLTGGASLFDNLAGRLQRELAKNQVECTVNAFRNADILPYVGASMISTHPGFDDKWLTKKAYEEEGSSAIHRIGAKRVERRPLKWK